MELDDHANEVVEESSSETDEVKLSVYELHKQSAVTTREDPPEDSGWKKCQKVRQDQATSSAARSSSQAATPPTKASKLLPDIRKAHNKLATTLQVTLNNSFNNFTSNSLG